MASKYLREIILVWFLAPAGSPSVPGCSRFCLTAAPQQPQLGIRHTGSSPHPSWDSPAESSSIFC